MSYYKRAYERLHEYQKEATWWEKRYKEKPLIAYFSAEFGIAESLPIYSGGLGVLAGDHLKSASDLGVPLVGVGLLYQQGYFRQYLTSDGWQQESYPTNDFYNLPVEAVPGPGGAPLKVEVTLAGQPLRIQVWKAQVGRLPLYLMDTNIPENPHHLQNITDQLYGGDHETRIQQEIVLGIGGLPALAALGLKPVVCHMNEGHAAFLALERIRLVMKEAGLSFREALEAARAGSAFTTHTTAAGGFDLFTTELVGKYLGDYVREMGISFDELMALGRKNPSDHHEPLNIAVLALPPAPRQRGEPVAGGGAAPPLPLLFGRHPRARGPRRPRHQRRPHPHLGLARDGPALRPLPGPRVVAAPRQALHLEERGRHPRRRALVHPRAPPGAHGHLRPPPPDAAARAPRRLTGRNRPRPRRPQHPHPHHRLRPPLRHLQARHPAAARPGTD